MTSRRPPYRLLTLLLLALAPVACDRPAPPPVTPTPASDAATPAAPEARTTTPATDTLTQTARPASIPSAATLVKFDPPALDLGLLDAEKTLNARGTVTNISDQPITFSRVQPSCACTDIRVPTGAIQPGQTVEFDLDFTPMSGTGVKRAAVRFFVEGALAPAEFTILGEVSLPIRVTPPHIDARNSMTGTLVVQSLDNKPFRILNVAGMAPHYLNNFEPAEDEPTYRYLLQWDLTMYDAETMPGWWVIETDRPDAPVVDVRVWHDWTRPDVSNVANLRWILSDQRILLNAIKPGESKEFEITMEPLKAGFTVETPIAASCPVDGVEVALVDSRGTDEGHIVCTVRVTSHLTETGLLYAPMTIHAPTQSRDVVLIGRVIAD